MRTVWCIENRKGRIKIQVKNNVKQNSFVRASSAIRITLLMMGYTLCYVKFEEKTYFS